MKMKDTIENAKFFDIDKYSNEVLDHLKDHEDTYYRKSSNGNLHVISFDPHIGTCLICSNYNDERYRGICLFNNKGKKWAEVYWTNSRSGKITVFQCVLLIHFVSIFVDEHTHYYFTDPKLIQTTTMLSNQNLWFTFHLAIWKGKAFEQIGSESDDRPEDDTEYNYKKFESMNQLQNILKDFMDNGIPKEFISTIRNG